MNASILNMSILFVQVRGHFWNSLESVYCPQKGMSHHIEGSVSGCLTLFPCVTYLAFTQNYPAFSATLVDRSLIHEQAELFSGPL